MLWNTRVKPINGPWRTVIHREPMWWISHMQYLKTHWEYLGNHVYHIRVLGNKKLILRTHGQFLGTNLNSGKATENTWKLTKCFWLEFLEFLFRSSRELTRTIDWETREPIENLTSLTFIIRTTPWSISELQCPSETLEWSIPLASEKIGYELSE